MTIALILTFGFLLRLVNLNQSLWLDETVQAITSKGPFLNLFNELRGDFHPPLYHLLMWGWVHLFGNREIVMRLPSVFFGTATIYVVYLIAKQIFPQKLEIGNWRLEIPKIAMLFLATAPFHIYYSQEARTYAMTTFFAALSIYFFIKLIKNPKTLAFGYVFSTVLLLYSDYYGLFVFLSQIIISLVILRKKATRFLLSYSSVLILFLPCLPLLWLQLKTGSQATALLPEWGRLVNLSFLKALPLTFVKFALGRITIFNKTLYAIVVGVLFLIYGVIIVKGFLRSKKFIIHNSLFIVFVWFFLPILLAWLISFFIPNYQPFRLLLVLPAFYLLLAFGVSKIATPMIRLIGVIFILLVNLFSLGIYYFNPYFHREDWRGLVKYIESQGEKNSLALLPSYNSHWPYQYYSEGKVKLISVAKDIKPVSQGDIQELSNSDLFSNIQYPISVYYIYYLTDLFDPQNLIPNWLERQKFVKIREVSFNQIKIEVWEK